MLGYGQINGTESPEVNPHLYSQMIFDKGAKIIQWGKGQSSPKMVLGKMNIHMQKNEDGHLPYTIYKNQLKMEQRPECKN